MRAATGAALQLIASVAAAQSYIISNVPLVVPSALEPNIILTLDDSAGMANAFPLSPDFSALAPINGAATSGSIAPANARRFKSSTFNALYYSPNVQYVVPANALTKGTSFTQALINGYYIGSGNISNWRVDLSNEYQPTLAFDASGNTQVLANHSCLDLSTLTASWNCVAGVPTPASAVSSVAPAYYANFNTASCSVSDSSDVGNDNCYTLVVIRSAQATYTIPPNGKPNNGRPDCTTSGTTTTCTYAQESQNFANWYSYYRTRHLAMISATWRVASDPRLIGTRVAWQALHNACNNFNTNNTCTGYSDTSGSVGSISNLMDEFSGGPPA